MKEFSIVLTTYMLCEHIREAIESVLIQTVKDYELIIIDDGSTDNTKEEVSKFKDKRIKYIWQAHTGLPGKVRNKGIEIAQGRLIAFLDGDNFWYPNKLKRCLEIFNSNPSIDVLCHDENYLRTYDRKVFRRTFYGPYGDDMYRELLLKGSTLSTSSTIIKRSIFSDDKFSFPENEMFTTAEEFDLWLKLAKSKRYHFFYLPEVLGVHRILESSVTLSNIEKAAFNMLYLLDENVKELNFTEKHLKALIKKRRSQLTFGAALAFNYRRKFSQSLRWNLKAIKECPLYWKPYLGFFASLFRIRLGYL